jgi:6-phosphogluconolactonase/glucosamine-6-phosphate isomerase/deaminase
VTLTLAAIDNAACVLMVASGSDKADALRSALEDEIDPRRRPAGAVAPQNGELIWLLEPQIARLLDSVRKDALV